MPQAQITTLITPTGRVGRPRSNVRERVVQAATDLMWENGLGEMSIDMILQRSGATKGALYHHFPTKLDLLLECLENVWRLRLARLEEIYDQALTPRQAVEQHLRFMADAQVQQHARLGFVPGAYTMSASTALLQEDPRIRRKMMDITDANRRYIARGIAETAEQEGFAINADEAARVLLYTVNGLMFTARLRNSLSPFRDLALVLNTTLKGLTDAD